MKRLAILLATLGLLAGPALASTYECDPTQGKKCTAKWRLANGSWDERTYEKGDLIIVGSADSVELDDGWDLVPG
jgi:hypothetical protein